MPRRISGTLYKYLKDFKLLTFFVYLLMSINNRIFSRNILTCQCLKTYIFLYFFIFFFNNIFENFIIFKKKNILIKLVQNTLCHVNQSLVIDLVFIYSCLFNDLIIFRINCFSTFYKKNKSTLTI